MIKEFQNKIREKIDSIYKNNIIENFLLSEIIFALTSKDELEDKYPDLKDQLEATGFKEEIPADVVPELPTKEQIAVKQMTFEGRNEPVYADALKETNEKYFLLDGTQFLEKNKYRMLQIESI